MTDSADNAVDVVGVSKIFGSGDQEVRALDDVSVSIRQNEFFTLLGPSGCGKTTLLRLLAGFEHPTRGQIFLNGKDIAGLPPNRRPVNTVFQSYALFPHLTVGQNIGFGLEMLGKPKDEVEDTVDRMLKLVRMEALKKRRTSQISGGQQQRVALARALAPHPEVLLLDEPLSALDFKLRKEMQLELKRLQNETGITFIFVTHDQEEALTMSDRVAVMRDGNILQVGSPRDIYDRPAERFVADFIGDSNFLRAVIKDVSGGRARLALDAGMETEAELPDGMAESGAVTVVVRPEQARFLDGEPGARETVLEGRVETVVYFGTDTHYHMTLSSGERFIARIQNDDRGERAPEQGSAVRVAIPTRAVQVLKD
ncbi:ABC transporter ATP-binding protein [Marivibrio halodurans]|uniref:Spermidine/putrescine import ATP-binding protein PotA n=1 Tax=Marivibrio halodurans TaxID=2039722 RepID=A0A8J7SI06_9PROT|nr:ABC transporter ATP-binding protein [Marivibrio halodurans]MBP5856778.1 ABC transporter ATP-binding protein [Marivibrio halodurans]